MSDEMPAIPILDIRALVAGADDRGAVAAQIGEACRSSGFFYVVGHGVDEGLQQRLERLSQRFFALDEESKLGIRMALGGSAWRGYFPLGGELTSGLPDRKEGIYFGAELDDDAAERWDRSSVRTFDGTYGEYLLSKVSKVFPELRGAVL
jgi:isopenicillin N synthase-like dioxygenase